MILKLSYIEISFIVGSHIIDIVREICLQRMEISLSPSKISQEYIFA